MAGCLASKDGGEWGDIPAAFTSKYQIDKAFNAGLFGQQMAGAWFGHDRTTGQRVFIKQFAKDAMDEAETEEITHALNSSNMLCGSSS